FLTGQNVDVIEQEDVHVAVLRPEGRAGSVTDRRGEVTDELVRRGETVTRFDVASLRNRVEEVGLAAAFRACQKEGRVGGIRVFSHVLSGRERDPVVASRHKALEGEAGVRLVCLAACALERRLEGNEWRRRTFGLAGSLCLEADTNARSEDRHDCLEY